MTAFDRIEKLKQDYTDRYVVVDRSRPELMRFRERTGQVKTVNMSGRALVEFKGHNDIGWYDIEIDFLKVVDKPDESASKTTAKKAPKKPIAEKEPSSLEKARAEKTATAKAGGKPKMSTADILAAARAKKQGGAAAPATKKAHTAKAHTAKDSTAKDSTEKAAAPKKKSGKMSTSDILAAARAGKSGGPSPAASESQPAGKPAPQASPAKTDRSKMSTADILAAARAAKTSTQESAESAATASETEKPVAEKPVAEKPVAEKLAEEQTASVESSTPASAPAGDLPTDTAGIIAYCRQNGGS